LKKSAEKMETEYTARNSKCSGSIERTTYDNSQTLIHCSETPRNTCSDLQPPLELDNSSHEFLNCAVGGFRVTVQKFLTREDTSRKPGETTNNPKKVSEKQEPSTVVCLSI
jgi:hypothetical protein